ncbi:MAG: hypothetical protein N2712_03580 [Brevinematales bacterium]|nr:hypothetical protein [Brevinematales bacterium]
MLVVTGVSEGVVSNFISFRFDNKFDFFYFRSFSAPYTFSSLLNNKTNFMFSFHFSDSGLDVKIGDIWSVFGRGIVVGDNRYGFLTRYLYHNRFYSNDVLSFNYDKSDRNFDGIQDIRKGSSFGLLNTKVFALFSDDFEDSLFGGFLRVQGIDLLFANYVDSSFVSINHKNQSLEGIVYDFEFAILFKNGVSYAFSWLLEWYYRKFEFSLEGRILEDRYYSPFTSSFFSIDYVRKGIIFSSIYRDDDFKFSYVNKLVFDNLAYVTNEFSIFVMTRVFDFSFFDIEILRDESQKKVFIYVYPYISSTNFAFYVKPLFCLDEIFFDFENLQISFWCKIGNFRFSSSVFLPFDSNFTYIFYSTFLRDGFGDNFDIPIYNVDGITSLIGFSILSHWLESEILLFVSQNGGFKVFLMSNFKV